MRVEDGIGSRPRKAGPKLSTETLSGLEYAVVSNALIYPNAITSSHGSVRGGVAPVPGGPRYLFQNRQAGGRIVTVTRFRHDDPTGHLVSGETLPVVNGRYMYLGPIHQHFGHFITETMTRVWLYLSAGHTDLRVLAMPEVDSVEDRENFRFDSLEDWQKEIFGYFGITDMEFVTRGAVYEELLVPQQAGILFSDYHPAEYRELLTTHKNSYFGTLMPDQKVFYRRPRRDVGGKFAGESYLSDFLGLFGYSSVYSDELSGMEQLRLAASCRRVISSQGSALHAFNLLGNSAVDCLVVQRSNTSVWQGFLRTFAPYVRSVDTFVPEVMLPSQNRNVVPLGILAMQDFLKKLNDFDPDIDPQLFDWSAYEIDLLRDIALFVD